MNKIDSLKIGLYEINQNIGPEEGNYSVDNFKLFSFLNSKFPNNGEHIKFQPNKKIYVFLLESKLLRHNGFYDPLCKVLYLDKVGYILHPRLGKFIETRTIK